MLLKQLLIVENNFRFALPNITKLLFLNSCRKFLFRIYNPLNQEILSNLSAPLSDFLFSFKLMIL